MEQQPANHREESRQGFIIFNLKEDYFFKIEKYPPPHPFLSLIPYPSFEKSCSRHWRKLSRAWRLRPPDPPPSLATSSLQLYYDTKSSSSNGGPCVRSGAGRAESEAGVGLLRGSALPLTVHPPGRGQGEGQTTG